MSVSTRGTCPEPELLTAFADGEVDATERALVVEHLADCEDCTAAVAAERHSKATLHRLADPTPSAELLARLASVPEALADVPELRPAASHSRAPAFMAAAASIVVFMVGAFAFIGASANNPGSTTPPAGTTAIVPAADSYALEHAATTSQAGLAGPGFSTVSYAVDAATAAAVAP